MVNALTEDIIELPEWTKGKHIYIFAGTELLAFREVRITHEDGKHVSKYLPFKIKPDDGRCNPKSCKPNSCCTQGGLSKTQIGDILDALLNYDSNDPACPLLTDNGCLMKAWIPFSCAKSVCTAYEGCTERMETVE